MRHGGKGAVSMREGRMQALELALHNGVVWKKTTRPLWHQSFFLSSFVLFVDVLVNIQYQQDRAHTKYTYVTLDLFFSFFMGEKCI